MKKFSLFFVYLFTLFSIIFVPTLAKYQSKEFGDLFHADFNKETVFEGVYIKNLEVVETKNASIVSSSYILPTNVSTIVNTSTTNSSITYKVTVHNNTDSTYWYFDQHFNKEFESNNLLGVDNGITVTTKDKLSDTTETFNNEDWVPPQTERDFYVTYTFGANARGYTTRLIAFHFDIEVIYI